MNAIDRCSVALVCAALSLLVACETPEPVTETTTTTTRTTTVVPAAPSEVTVGPTSTTETTRVLAPDGTTETRTLVEEVR
jgi:hypothetical protein